VVDVGGVFQNNKVEPPAATFPAGADTPFPACHVNQPLSSLKARGYLTDSLELGSILSKILSLEDTLADSGGLFKSEKWGTQG
jgi:hypothetical protein